MPVAKKQRMTTDVHYSLHTGMMPFPKTNISEKRHQRKGVTAGGRKWPELAGVGRPFATDY